MLYMKPDYFIQKGNNKTDIALIFQGSGQLCEISWYLCKSINFLCCNLFM